MSDTLDELRIIASDGGTLSKADCAVLNRAADELENAYRMLISTQAALIESQARRLALRERVLESKQVAPGGSYGHAWRFTWDNLRIVDHA